MKVLFLAVCLLAGCQEGDPEEPLKAGQEMENALGMKLCWIPPGKFTSGSPEDEAQRVARWEAQVDVELTRGFWIGKYEVTQGEYGEVMEIDPATQLEYEGMMGIKSFRHVGKRAPEYGVNWEMAMDFCKELTEWEQKRGKLPEGWTYTLPTDAQWEYACRAGEKGPYSGGEPDEVAWHQGNSGDTLHPVGKKRANPWGLHDMHGNVWEWCRDSWAPKRKAPGGVLIDPVNPTKGDGRAIRGGSWRNPVDMARCGRRESRPPGMGVGAPFGIRVVLIPDQPWADGAGVAE